MPEMNNLQTINPKLLNYHQLSSLFSVPSNYQRKTGRPTTIVRATGGLAFSPPLHKSRNLSPEALQVVALHQLLGHPQEGQTVQRLLPVRSRSHASEMKKLT